MTWLEGRGLMDFTESGPGDPQPDRLAAVRGLVDATDPAGRDPWRPASRQLYVCRRSRRAEAARLNLLDFGCIRIFPPSFVDGVLKLYRALIADDHEAQAEAYRVWGFKGLSRDLIDTLNIWAKFIYGPLLDDRVRTVADGVSLGAYGRRARGVFQVKQALDKLGPVTVPREFVFMERAAIGLGAAFLRLGAEMNWRQVFEATLDGFTEAALAERQGAALAAVGLV